MRRKTRDDIWDMVIIATAVAIALLIFTGTAHAQTDSDAERAATACAATNALAASRLRLTFPAGSAALAAKSQAWGKVARFYGATDGSLARAVLDLAEAINSGRAEWSAVIDIAENCPDL